MLESKKCGNIREYLGKTVQIKIDRPLGSAHPEHRDMIYPINYGYIPNVMGGDGEEVDAYLLGVDKAVEECTAKVIGIVYRINDVENKLVAAPEGIKFSRKEIRDAIQFQEQYFRSEIELAKE